MILKLIEGKFFISFCAPRLFIPYAKWMSRLDSVTIIIKEEEVMMRGNWGHGNYFLCVCFKTHNDLN